MARSSFIFRMQRLLDIRIMREKQAQHELLARRNQLALEQQQLVVLKQEADALEHRMTPRQGERIDFEEIRMCTWALKKKVEEQEAQEQKIVQAEQRVTQQKEAVKQAGIQVKALEKLKEKQLEEHQHEQLAAEAVFLDDLASQQFIRRGTEEIRLTEEAAYEETAQ